MTEPTLEQQLRFGAPGSRIPGSRFIRAYCAVCGEPMRVSADNHPQLQECQDCHGALPRKILNQRRALRSDTR